MTMKQAFASTLGYHMWYPRILPDGKQSGHYESGAFPNTLAALNSPWAAMSTHSDISLSRDKAPFCVVKLYYTGKVRPAEPDVTEMIGDIWDSGHRIWIQVVDESASSGADLLENCEHAVDLVYRSLGGREQNAVDVREGIYMSYGNEVDAMEPDDKRRSWYFEQEALAGVIFQKHGFSVGMGNDGGYMASVLHLEERAILFRKHGVLPKAMAIHAYGQRMCGALIDPVVTLLCAMIQDMPDELSLHLPKPVPGNIVWTEAGLTGKYYFPDHEAPWFADFLTHAAEVGTPTCYFFMKHLSQQDEVAEWITSLNTLLSLDGRDLTKTDFQAAAYRFHLAAASAMETMKKYGSQQADRILQVEDAANELLTNTRMDGALSPIREQE